MTEHNRTAGEYLQAGSISNLGILAASLTLRLTLDELEWLCGELEKRVESKRREAGGEVSVLASYRDGWEP